MKIKTLFLFDNILNGEEIMHHFGNGPMSVLNVDVPPM